MRRTLLVLLGALSFSAPLAAQANRPAQPPPSGPGELRGTVVDADSRAGVGSATIEVFNGGDALVAGAIARADGAFRIEGLPPGSYRLKVTMIGYTTQSTGALQITPSEPRVNAGPIALVRAAIALESVEVNAESQVVIAPDRNIYRARDVAPAAATATDVLENVPSVEVDAEGKLSLRGNENLVVQINGRPTPIRGPQLAAYLKQLPASTIERIEVIPNPSARQDPEGMAGIVNIVMKQTVDLGRSGGFMVAASSNPRFAASGNFGYQAGALTFFATYGFFRESRDVTGINDRTRLTPSGAPLLITEQAIDGSNRGHSHNASVNIERRLNARYSIFATGMLNMREGTDRSVSAHTELNGSRTLLDRYDRTRGTSADALMADGTVGFRSIWKPQQHELTGEVRLNSSDDTDRTELWRVAFVGDDRRDGEENTTDAGTDQLTAQLDYTRMLGKATKLETGYKGNIRWLDRDYRALRDDEGAGEWAESGLSNILQLDEQVHAVYGVMSRAAGRFQLQAGLRVEHAEREFSLEDGTEYPYTYRSLFPSGLISTKLGSNTEAKLSYSRRVRRPGTQELNPFPQFFDAQNVFFGNPELGPEYTDAIELGLLRSGRMGSLQLAPFYRRTTDIIRVDINTADSIMGREVTSISFRNVATSNSWGADLNGQFRLSPKFNGLAAMNVFKMVTDGGSESSLSSDAVTWSARLNANYVLSPVTMLQYNFFYRAPVAFEGGRFSGVTGMNVAVRQKLRGDALTATLRVTDPFATNRMEVNVGDDNVHQFTSRYFSVRGVHLSVQGMFGQAPRVRQPRPEDAPAPQTGFPPPGG